MPIFARFCRFLQRQKMEKNEFPESGIYLYHRKKGPSQAILSGNKAYFFLQLFFGKTTDFSRFLVFFRTEKNGKIAFVKSEYTYTTRKNLRLRGVIGVTGHIPTKGKKTEKVRPTRTRHTPHSGLDGQDGAFFCCPFSGICSHCVTRKIRVT